MHIQVKVKGLPGAAALRQHARRRLEAILAVFAQWIAEVSVQLGDINGPERGGVDQLCRIVVSFRHSAVLVVEELGSDMMRVIDRIAERLRQSLARRYCPA